MRPRFVVCPSGYMYRPRHSPKPGSRPILLRMSSTAQPPSVGPTAASPLTTSTGSALDEDLTLPAPTLKERRLSSDIIVFKDPATGKPSEVRDHQRSTSIVETSSSDDSDSEHDTEEWLADAHGGFTPSPKRGNGTSQWNPSSLRQDRGVMARADRARAWAARPVMRRSQVVLMVLAILLGPNLCPVSYTHLTLPTILLV